jgi:general secretion pathway protein C
VDARKFLFVSKLAIGLVLLYTGGSMLMEYRNARELFAPSSAGGGERQAASDAVIGANTAGRDFSDIQAKDIFRAGGKSSGQSGEAPISAAKELGIELVGTVAGAPEVSRAIIRNTKTNSLGLYSKGQMVAGATIESISLNAVDLLHNGKVKTLTLKTTGAQGRVSSSISNSAKTQTKTRASTYLPANRLDPRSVVAARSRAGYVDQILTNATIEPYAVNGKVEGLKITGLEKVPAATSLGLRDGDIVRHVNGQQLTSLQKAFQVFQKAKSQPAINLGLSRDGESKELTFDLR